MREEIQKLLNHCMEYATELLTETGESYPFAAYIDTIGNVHPLEMEIDTKNVPKLGTVVESLKKYCELEMSERRMHGYALAYEVKIKLDEKTETDAIAFDLHHADEKNLPNYYLPFSTTAEKSVTIGEVFAVKQRAL